MSRFNKAYVEITNICNLSCTFCPKTKRQPQEISVSQFQKVTAQIKPYTSYLYLHIQGEPTRHSQFEDIMKVAYEQDFKVCLTTNGTNIERVLNCAKQLESNRPLFHKINISLQAIGGNPTLDVENFMLENIRCAKELASMGSIVVYRLWNQGGNEEKNDCIITMLSNEYNVQIDGKTKLCDRTFFERAEEFEWWTQSERENIYCYGLKDQFGILVDGTVVPCCLDSEGDIPLGNALSDSLKNALESKLAKDIFEGFQKRCAVTDRCKHCGYPRRF